MSAEKCDALSWCAGMKMVLYGVPENFEGKGLSVSRGWLGEEKTPRKLGVIYRQRANKDRVVLNFCPWCGARIRFDEQTREDIVAAIAALRAP